MRDDKSPYVRIAELEEENRQLRMLPKPDIRKVEPWNLTPTQHDILSAIVAGSGHYVSRERLAPRDLRPSCDRRRGAAHAHEATQ